MPRILTGVCSAKQTPGLGGQTLPLRWCLAASVACLRLDSARVTLRNVTQSLEESGHLLVAQLYRDRCSAELFVLTPTLSSGATL